MKKVLLRRVFFPLYHKLKKTGVMDVFRELEITQWLSPDDIFVLQQKKLCALLIHAWKNVPFYRKRFEDAGLSLSDLYNFEAFSKIPVLTKEDINNNRNDMIAENHAGERLLPNSTSGSTGDSLYFFTDLRSWAARRATVLRNQKWLGIEIGDPQATLWGAPMDLRRTQKLRGKLHRWFNNYIFLSSYDLSEKTLKTYVHRLNKFRPALLISYPGPLCELSEYILIKKITIPPPKAIISSAETLFPWQKDIIERAFLAPVYNRYGCREFGDIAQECQHREGLHINAERVFVEILDHNMAPCSPGDTGEVIVTDLDNYGMPLIRYRIGDRAVYSSRNCSCGRGLPLLREVEGRVLDVIRAPNGVALGGTFWTLLFRSKPGISAFQVVQENNLGIEVKYVRSTNSDVDSVPIDYFLKKIHEKCGKDFYVKFTEVSEIPKTQSGKTRFVVSKVSHVK